MPVFEFHFNPKLKTDAIFNCFCFKPENIYEKQRGSLYIIGFLKNVLPQNLRLLDKLAQVIKEKYYTLSYRIKNNEQALSESLKRANEFLAEEVKKENVSWLGNLSLAILSLKDFDLNFTKVGHLEIFLSRAGKINDIGKNLAFQEIEPYPLKVFSNIVSGRLAEEDMLLIFSQEIFEIFQEENLIEEVVKLKTLEEKGLKEIFKKGEERLSKASGIFLLISLARERDFIKREIFLPPAKEFSIKEALLPSWNFLKKISQNLKKKIEISRKFPKLKWEIFSQSQICSAKAWLSKFKSQIILILLLIFLLILGFFIF